MRSASALLQGQDESEETRKTLESCNAIGGAIEFTSVAIDAIKVHRSLCHLPIPSSCFPEILRRNLQHSCILMCLLCNGMHAWRIIGPVLGCHMCESFGWLHHVRACSSPCAPVQPLCCASSRCILAAIGIGIHNEARARYVMLCARSACGMRAKLCHVCPGS